MGKQLDIGTLSKYIGNTFNWLTVLDVVKTSKVMFKCKCQCGKILDIYYRYVLSGHTKSCGCYIHSKEHRDNLNKLYSDNPERVANISIKRKQWCESHPEDVALAAAKHSAWCKNNPDKVKEQSARYSEWCKNNPDKIKEKSEKYKQWLKNNPDKATYIIEKVSKWAEHNPDKVQQRVDKYKDWCKSHRSLITDLGKQHSKWLQDNIEDIIRKASNTKRLNRCQSDITALIEIIHPKYINDLINGNIKSCDTIETKCPACGNYAPHSFHNVFKFRSSKFKNNPPMCNSCVSKLSSSSSEQEIANYISTFYHGELIKNSRAIIQPFELDLYYPEKKIAIEFNGDYWHDENHKQKDYHFNKYILCKESGILLVSIFETYWLINNDAIKSYLYDLFSNKENLLSFKHELLNNNYPSPHSINVQGDYIEDYYIHRDKKVFTCGYTKLH